MDRFLLERLKSWQSDSRRKPLILRGARQVGKTWLLQACHIDGKLEACMDRFLLERLKSWQSDSRRKPLILRGARQVGKTWLLQEFGKTCFDNVAYVRLEDNAAMSQLFEGSLDPRRIVTGISAATGEPINVWQDLF